jgi:predicted GNAT family acetyltransferase
VPSDLPDGVTVDDHPDDERFVLLVDGAPAGFLRYHVHGRVFTAIHTEIDPAFGGRGLGSVIVGHVLADVRRRGLRLQPHCPFVARYVQRHPDAADVVGGSAAETEA